IPGLQIQEQSANNPGFVIRGITSDNGSSQQGARVTLYYNGIDISRSRGAYQDLFDLSRIEVVKGPQATLFGTAAAVGAISLVSAKPEPGVSGAINGTYGNFDRTQVSGFLNAGNDVLAGRIAFAYKYRKGYVRNIAGDANVPNQNQGGVDQDDLNGQDQRGIRGSLRYRPSDSITADLVLTYDGQRNPGTAFKSRAHAPTGGQTGDYGYAELSGSPYSAAVLGARKLGLDRNVYDANLTITADLSPGITFTTVNGYRKFDALEVFDADGGPAAYLEFAEDAKGDQWSHESRFAFEGPKYRTSVGWNAFFENGFQRVPFATEEGTYLACSVTPAYAPIRAALN
ncbi:MAG: TonB-dependent receptor, partial [Sphingomonas sp.]